MLFAQSNKSEANGDHTSMTDESNSFIGVFETWLIAAISAQRTGRDPKNVVGAKKICISCHIFAMLFDGEEVAGNVIQSIDVSGDRPNDDPKRA